MDSTSGLQSLMAMPSKREITALRIDINTHLEMKTSSMQRNRRHIGTPKRRHF